MRRTLPLLTLLALLLFGAFLATPAFAIDFSDPNWEYVDSSVVARCKRLDKVVPPVADMPTAAQRKELKSCSSEALYYGMGMPTDPVKARLCAFAEDQDSGREDEMFGGKNVLMMIYANGMGVPQNLDLAQRYACEAGFAGAEITGRSEHLENIRNGDTTGGAFDLCDDITSGYMQGFCASHYARMEDTERNARLKSLMASWSDEEKQAFEKLHAIFEEFVAARVENEVDLSGTARAAFEIGEESTQRNLFAAQIAQFESRKWFPAYTERQFQDADRDLNVRYGKVQRTPKSEWKDGYGPWGTVTKKGILDTQRAWLKYREAWVTFGALKYPAVPADAWRTWLTRKRAEMLKEFLPEN